MERFLAWPSRPDRGFTRGEITQWWGSRRVRYNVYVLASGAISFAITLLVDSPSDFSDWEDWLLTALLLLIGANACYTFGWIIDVIFFRAKPTRVLYQAGVVFSLSLASVPAAWSVATYFGGHNAHRVARTIPKQIASGATEVDVGKIADFDWDQMFVFGPYAPKDWICKEDLKISKWQCSAAGVENVGEGENLLVFMKQGKVVDVETLGRAFDESERCISRSIRREEAKFTVVRKQTAKLVCK